MTYSADLKITKKIVMKKEQESALENILRREIIVINIWP